MAENRRATLAGLAIAGLALIGSFFVTEVRRFFGLEPVSALPKEARSEAASVPHVPESRPESGSTPTAPEVARVPPAQVSTDTNESLDSTTIKGSPAAPAREKSFGTESYRLTAGGVKKSG